MSFVQFHSLFDRRMNVSCRHQVCSIKGFEVRTRFLSIGDDRKLSYSKELDHYNSIEREKSREISKDKLVRWICRNSLFLRNARYFRL
jgi:hypothetical protein